MADAERENRMREISEQLEQGVKDLFTTEQYTTYLKVMDKFHEYSFNNQVLIASQKPDATLVAGYQAWQKNFNRHVKRGEKGIRIIAPMPAQRTVTREKKDEQTGNILRDADGTPQTEEVSITVPRFRAVTVFDVSQTEGEPLPERPGAEMLTAHIDDYSAFMAAIRKVSPVPIRFEDDIPGTANGYYDPQAKEIVIRDGMPEAQTVKTAIHEVTHARLHDPDRIDGRKDQVTREVEAESTAFIICNHFGIDTSAYTFPYIAAWSSSVEMKELKESMDTIRHAASDIIDDLTEHLEAELDPEQVKAMQDNTPSTGRETTYEIYQVSKPNVEYEFMGMDFVDKLGLKVSADDYSLVYSGSLSNVDRNAELDTLYRKFNISHPSDFKGHSMSTSDVVVLRHGEEIEAFYVDSVGFKPLPNFIKELQHGQKQKDDVAKNIECKRAIEKAINENYDHKTSHLDTTKAVRSVVSEYGADRVQYVLAVTVALKDWDGRFSPGNKAWAKEQTTAEAFNDPGVDTRNAYIIDSHPALLNGFINRVRKYTEIAQDTDREKTIESFAERLDRFAQEYDAYEYKDSVTNPEQHVSEITEQIQNGNTDGLKIWLKDIVETSDNPTEISEAKELSKDLTAFDGNDGRERINTVYAPAYDSGKWKVTEIDLTQARWVGHTMEYRGIAYDRNREVYTTESAAWKYINNDPTAYQELVKFDSEHRPYLAAGKEKEEHIQNANAINDQPPAKTSIWTKVNQNKKIMNERERQNPHLFHAEKGAISL